MIDAIRWIIDWLEVIGFILFVWLAMSLLGMACFRWLLRYNAKRFK